MPVQEENDQTEVCPSLLPVLLPTQESGHAQARERPLTKEYSIYWPLNLGLPRLGKCEKYIPLFKTARHHTLLWQKLQQVPLKSMPAPCYHVPQRFLLFTLSIVLCHLWLHFYSFILFPHLLDKHFKGQAQFMSFFTTSFHQNPSCFHKHLVLPNPLQHSIISNPLQLSVLPNPLQLSPP